MKLFYSNISLGEKVRTNSDLLHLINEIKLSKYGTNTKLYKNLDFFTSEDFCKYREFSIEKKNGGQRKIYAPSKKNKTILKIINTILCECYNAHDNAYGFIKGKSIKDNASVHVGSRYVWNIDLVDFFNNIGEHLICSRLQKYPFSFNRTVANTITEICMINTNGSWILPQGFPTSPVLSNMVCEVLDKKLTGLSERYDCNYTRYADDISFSSNHNIFDTNSEFTKEVYDIIEQLGFYVNTSKVRLRSNSQRQEVTGLIVSDIVNVKKVIIREIRSLLYVWERYGYNVALSSFYEKHKPKRNLINFLLGKLAFVKYIKGECPLYTKLAKRFKKLYREQIEKIEISTSEYHQYGYCLLYKEIAEYVDGLQKSLVRFNISNGRERKEFMRSYTYNQKRQLSSIATYWYDRDLGPDMSESFVYRNNKLCQSTLKSNDELYKSTTTYSYVFEGYLCVEEKKMCGNVTHIAKNKYNSRGMLVERRIFLESTLETIFRYEYDDMGNRIKEYTTSIKNGFTGHIVYDYDRRGNWIAKEVFRENQPIRKVKRTIKYSI